MEKIFSPENEGELAMVKGLLEAAQIPFYVQNEHFGGLYSGPQIQHLNQRVIMVAPEYTARAKEIIAECIATLQPQEPEARPRTEPASIAQKLRSLGDALLSGWRSFHQHRAEEDTAPAPSIPDEKSKNAPHPHANHTRHPTSESEKRAED